MKAIGKRIATLREAKGWSCARAGREFANLEPPEKEVTGTTIDNWEKGKALTFQAIPLLAKLYCVTEKYLIFNIKPDTDKPTLTDEETALVESFRATESSSHGMIIEIAGSIQRAHPRRTNKKPPKAPTAAPHAEQSKEYSL